MFTKCLATVLLCSMMIGFSHQQVVIPSYASAYYPTAYAYPSVYSPYLSYPTVFAWGSNKNKNDAPGVPTAPASLVNNRPTSA